MDDKTKKHVSKDGSGKKKMSRKEALKRTGFYAFSAATMMLLLNQPSKAQTDDSSEFPADPDEW